MFNGSSQSSFSRVTRWVGKGNAGAHCDLRDVYLLYREQGGDLLPADLAGEFLKAVTERPTTVWRWRSAAHRAPVDSDMPTQSCS